MMPRFLLCRVAGLALATGLLAEARTVVRERDFAKEKSKELKPGTAIIETKDGNRAAPDLFRQLLDQELGSASGVKAWGPCVLRVWLRGEGLRGIENGLMLSLVMINEKTQAAFPADGIVCGSRVTEP